MFQLNRWSKPPILLLAFILGLFWGTEIACAKDKSAIMLFPTGGSKKTQEKSDKTLPEIPENLDRAKINEIIAGLSDDQVRRLLIHELELAAEAKATARKQTTPEASGVARLAQIAERNINAFHKQLKNIRDGAVAVPDFLPKAYADLRGPGGTSSILMMFAAILALLASGVGAEWLFARYTADMRKRLATSPPVHWMVKVKRLLLSGAVELFSVCVFSGVALIVFFSFFNRGPAARLAFMTFLVVVLAVRGIGLLSHFLLAPFSPALRFLPLTDPGARSLHRWVMAFALFLGASFLVRGLLELQGVSQESIIFLRAANAAVIFCMLVYLVLSNREPVAQIICRGSGDRSAGINLFRSQLASFWHLLSLPYLALQSSEVGADV